MPLPKLPTMTRACTKDMECPSNKQCDCITERLIVKVFEIYTSCMYGGEPLCIVSEPVQDFAAADDLIEGVMEFDYEKKDFVRVKGGDDQIVRIANVYVKRGDIIYVAEKHVGKEDANG